MTRSLLGPVGEEGVLGRGKSLPVKEQHAGGARDGILEDTGQVGLALTLKEAHDGRRAQGSDVAICHLRRVWATCWET